MTIDGPAGAGKSTVAKALAKRLKFSYLDTGAMYRAVTLKALRFKVNLDDEKALAAVAKAITIDFQEDPNKGLRVILDGEDVSEAIRTVEVTNNTFYMARAPKVRAVMVDLQRKIGSRRDIVVEGRDVGTVVFPNATYKFYLDADFAERARRRIKELEDKGQAVEAQKLKQELQERDQKDFSRKVGPLKKADDAIVIDSTHLSIESTIEKIMEVIKSQKVKMSKSQTSKLIKPLTL